MSSGFTANPAWLVDRRSDSDWKPYFDHAYGKRPRAELFDLSKDPHQMRNVAAWHVVKELNLPGSDSESNERPAPDAWLQGQDSNLRYAA